MSTPKPSRQLIAKLLMATFATALALGVGEVAIRIVGLAPEVIPIGVSNEENVHQRSANPILSYELKPNYRSETADGKNSYPYTNSHGQRDIEREYEKPAGNKRILLLGDSVVVGHGIQDIENLMSQQLEKLYPEGEVEVLNLAVAGYCTRAEIELLKEKGLRYDPDLVILVFVQNDFTNFQRETQVIEGIHQRPALVKSLFQLSHMFRLACLKMNLFGYGLEADPARWNQLALGDNNVDEGFKLLRELAEKNQFEVLIAAWPYFDEDSIYYSDEMLMPEQTEELIAERIAKMYGLQVLHLADGFKKVWDSLSPRPNPNEYFTIGDTMHPSTEGNRTAAEILFNQIKEQNLLHSEEPLRTLTKPSGTRDEAALMAARGKGTEEANYADLYFNQGLTAKREGRLEEAAEAYAKAVELAPSDAEYRNNYGNLLRILGQHQEALRELTQAVELDEDLFDAQYNLALTHEAMENTQEATHRLNLLIKTSPKYALAHSKLANLEFESKNYDGAIEHQQNYVQLKPDDVQGLNNLGYFLLEADRIDQATKVLQSVVATLPDFALGRLNLAEAYFKWGKLELAKQHAEKADALAQSHGQSDLSEDIDSLLQSISEASGTE